MPARYISIIIFATSLHAYEAPAFPACTRAESDQSNPAQPVPSTNPGTCPFTDYTPAALPIYSSYNEAIKAGAWNTPEDLNAWLAKNFAYSEARMASLINGDGQLRSDAKPLSEAELFLKPAAAPLDLSFFIVETLRRMDPALAAGYLSIDFEPCTYNRLVLRRHWLASFQRKGKWFFLGDSKYRGRIYGPFDSELAFRDCYQALRGRKILDDASNKFQGFAAHRCWRDSC